MGHKNDTNTKEGIWITKRTKQKEHIKELEDKKNKNYNYESEA
jgi:hypothetical protein